MVEVKSPPIIMVAIGPSISLPGWFDPNAIGVRAKPATKAVINIEGSLSLAPLIHVSKFHKQFSLML